MVSDPYSIDFSHTKTHLRTRVTHLFNRQVSIKNELLSSKILTVYVLFLIFASNIESIHSKICGYLFVS